MTNKLSEFAIETFAIELLEKQGYKYIYGTDTAPVTSAERLRHLSVPLSKT